ncbi:uncharacterized protein [Rutidosis leptorrhynchoides]|uniref:uncharacterized protein n=1 Tax=Rutidosis leptorrhynchoides TaxID=125765 RepID=UPI003A995A25
MEYSDIEIDPAIRKRKVESNQKLLSGDSEITTVESSSNANNPHTYGTSFQINRHSESAKKQRNTNVTINSPLSTITTRTPLSKNNQHCTSKHSTSIITNRSPLADITNVQQTNNTATSIGSNEPNSKKGKTVGRPPKYNLHNIGVLPFKLDFESQDINISGGKTVSDSGLWSKFSTPEIKIGSSNANNEELLADISTSKQKTRVGRPLTYTSTRLEHLPMNNTIMQSTLTSSNSPSIQKKVTSNDSPSNIASPTVSTASAQGHTVNKASARSRGRPKKNDTLNNVHINNTMEVAPPSTSQVSHQRTRSKKQPNNTSVQQNVSSSNANNVPAKRRGRKPGYTFSDSEMIPLRSCGDSLNNPSSSQTESEKESPISKDYRDIGDPIYICTSCKARLWKSEAMRGNKSFGRKSYTLCCLGGKVELPCLNEPPTLLRELFTGNSQKSKHFIENIRKYNMMFSFTSIGGKLDHSVNSGGAPYVYRMCGQNYHLAGSLLPEGGQQPRFCQLYIYATNNEVENRINAYSNAHNSKKASKNSTSLAIDPSIVFEIKGLLDEKNPLVKQFRMARDRFDINAVEPIKMKLIGSRTTDGRSNNLPTTTEVAALIIGDLDGTTDKRDILLETQDKHLKRICELHPSYLALQYPLLFPYAEDGYRTDILHKGVEIEDVSGHIKLTIREFFAYRLQVRVGETSLILKSRQLLQQFIVDAYTMVENTRLNYIRNNQKAFRIAQAATLYEAQESGNYDVSIMGTRITLPSSFTGGARYMRENYMDAMAIVRAYGYPDLFITFTCNPNWPEILRFMKTENLKPEDRPDINTRVFKIKLDALVTQLKEEKLFGGLIGALYVVEFQKRGLPHAHICIFIDKTNSLPNASDIDNVICAEIPDKDDDPELYELVSEFMMHGPCGPDHLSCACMKKGKCSKRFPKDFTNETRFDNEGYPVYRRRDDGRFIMKSGTKLDNRNVVAFNKTLLKQYQAHINVEWCNQLGSIKYLFKYINKGADRISVSFQTNPNNNANQKFDKARDEIAEYFSCRYISACEASWRLFDYPILYRQPAVYRLSFHLPNQEPILFDAHDDMDSVLCKPSVGASQFLEWMSFNRYDSEARQYTYIEFPRHYVWNSNRRKWTKRTSQRTVGRIHFVPPKSGETYYLRILLNKVKGPTCYEDIRTVNGILYHTYKDACYAMGLLADDKEYIASIKEVHQWACGEQCRDLFVSLITSDSISCPERVWQQTCDLLSDDLTHEVPERLRSNDPDTLKHVLHNLALARIEKQLNRSGSTLKNITNMPFPDYEFIQQSCNMLIQDELSYDKETLREEHQSFLSTMTSEQKLAYDTIIASIDNDESQLFFLYGYGGTGKTFVWKTLAAAIRSRGDIVINVASSGIAALLLTGGRTAHSRFAIPINVLEDSYCSIKPESELAALLNQAKLIIWDEAPMMHRHCFEAFDRTMKDIIKSDKSSEPFGGKVVVFGGDFRQILPVIQRGTRSEIVDASLHSSYLWQKCKVLKLTKNMRLRCDSKDSERKEIADFAEWILKIGEGKINTPNDGEADVEFPDEILIETGSNPVETIVNSTYPSLHENLVDPNFFQNRAILATTNEEVHSINDHILSTLFGEERVYYSSDSLTPDEDNDIFAQQVYSPEILNGLKVPGVPNHRLALKVGVPIMLLRNIDQSKGLCNGTRLQVERMAEHTIEARIITGHCFGNLTYIPRMIIAPTDKKIAVKFQRRQFPVSVCFAMTINKSQGQSLSNVGLYLRKPVFTHGQLYVAVSRVTTKKGLKVVILDEDGKDSKTTKNVVYKEVLRRI